MGSGIASEKLADVHGKRNETERNEPSRVEPRRVLLDCEHRYDRSLPSFRRAIIFFPVELPVKSRAAWHVSRCSLPAARNRVSTGRVTFATRVFLARTSSNGERYADKITRGER